MENEKKFTPKKGDFVAWWPEFGHAMAVAAMQDEETFDVALGSQRDSQSGADDLWYIGNVSSDYCDCLHPASREEIGRLLAKLVEHKETFFVVKGKWVPINGFVELLKTIIAE